MPMPPSSPASITVSIVSHGQLDLVRPLMEELDRFSRGMVAKVVLTINIPEADAVNSRRTWLSDFAHDEITITTDLYEVILAYQHHIRPSA